MKGLPKCKKEGKKIEKMCMKQRRKENLWKEEEKKESIKKCLNVKMRWENDILKENVESKRNEDNTKLQRRRERKCKKAYEWEFLQGDKMWKQNNEKKSENDEKGEREKAK